MQTFINPNHSRSNNKNSTAYFPDTSMLGNGDSITAGFDATTEENRWINRLAAMKYGGGFRNLGINGTVLQNTDDNNTGSPRSGNYRDNYTSRALGANKRDHIYILYGVNDINNSIKSSNPVTSFTAQLFEEDFNYIIQDLLANGYANHQIFIGSPPYFTDNNNDFVLHEQYVQACRRVALNNGVKYMDIYQYMIDNGGASLLDGDEIHPNDAGHEVIANGWLLANYVSGRAPVNQSLPTIIGSPQSGETLSATKGVWVSDEAFEAEAYVYQWQADGADITGATSSTYTLTDNEIDSVIRVIVTATDLYGSTTAESAETDIVIEASDFIIFGDVSNTMQEWHDPTTNDADYMTLSGGDIVTFTGRENGNVMFEAINRPSITSINGNRAIYFDGTGEILAGSDYAYLNPNGYTAYLVVKPDIQPSGANNFYGFGYSDGNTFEYLIGMDFTQEGSVFCLYRNADGNLFINESGTTNLQNGNPHIIKVEDTITALRIYVDGVLELEDTSVIRSGTPDIISFGGWREDSDKYPYKGAMGDCVFYEGQLSASDDADLMTLLENRWIGS